MSSDSTRALSGPEKAAVLMMALGPERATQLISVLAAHEIELLASHVARTRDVDPETRSHVVEEFQTACAAGPAGQGGLAYARDLLTRALGPEKAATVISRLEFASETPDFSIESEKEADRLGRLLGGQHPQLAAAVLSRMPPELGARLLGCLPTEARLEVSLRVIDLAPPDVDAFRRLGTVLRTTLLSDHGAVSTPAEGRRRLAEILNSADRDVEHEVLTALSEHDPDLAKQIRDRMFTFEDLVELDPRELQIVLRTVPMEDLRMALQVAGEKLKEHIFANMSERAAAGLKEDMEAAGPSKPHQARAAQQRVAAVARRLAKEGTLTLKSEAESQTEPLEAAETSEATVADAPAGDDRSEPATGEARDAE